MWRVHYFDVRDRVFAGLHALFSLLVFACMQLSTIALNRYTIFIQKSI